MLSHYLLQMFTFWGASKMLRDSRVASKKEKIFWNVEEPSTIVALRLVPQAAV